MIKKIHRFIFLDSLKQKKLFIKENIFNDKDENFTVLFRIINKTVKNYANYYILDIGAYDGMSSVYFSKHFPQNKIIAFEPNKVSFQNALNNCRKNANISIHNIALSEKSGFSEFNITKNAVSSSLNSISGESAIIYGYSDELSIIEKTVAETKPLDDFELDNEILFIKIDTQGNEIKVLDGAKKTLNNTLFVLVKMSNHDMYVNGCIYYEVDNWFRTNGFKLVDVIILSRKNGIIATEFDAIYANQNKVPL